MIPERAKDHHPYYAWHARHSDTRFRMVGQVCAAPLVQAGVALHRTRNAGRYEPADIERFAVLHGHLERALAIGFRLGALGTMQRCTIELLDRNRDAILLLDDRRHIVYANRHAEALHSGADGISLRADGITLERRQDHDTLQSLVAEALSASSSRGGAMRVLRPSGKPAYLILISPVSRPYTALSAGRPAVCVIIADPDLRKPVRTGRLRAAFGLTEAEARLGVRLAAGDDLRSAAAKLGITYGTARARLAAIFQKTDTRRQAMLINLLLTTDSAD